MNKQANNFSVTRDKAKIAGVLNVIAGIGVLVSPWIYGYAADDGGAWNSVIVGIATAALALARTLTDDKKIWLIWINAILALWLIISPWVYGYASNTAGAVSSVVLGIILFILAAWGAQASAGPPQEQLL